jgi:methionyl-tRNA synthetase
MWSNVFGFGQFGTGMSVLLAIILVWSIVWKGLALWKAGRAGSKPWFIVMLIVNTVGILEIFYLYVFSRPTRKETTHTTPAA